MVCFALFFICLPCFWLVLSKMSSKLDVKRRYGRAYSRFVTPCASWAWRYQWILNGDISESKIRFDRLCWAELQWGPNFETSKRMDSKAYMHHRRKNPANLPGFSKITRQNTAVQKNPANKTRQNTTDDSKNQIAPQGENLSFYFMFLTFYVQKCLGNDHKILSASSKIKKIACGAPGDANRWKNLKNIKIFWKKSAEKINKKTRQKYKKPGKIRRFKKTRQ